MKKLLLFTLLLMFTSCLSVYAGDIYYVVDVQGRSAVPADIWHKIISSEIRPELGDDTEDWTVTIGGGILIAGSTHTGEVSGCIVDTTKVTINGKEFTYTDCGTSDSYADARYTINIDDIKPEFTANPDWEYWYNQETETIKARQKVASNTPGENSIITIYSGANYMVASQGRSAVPAEIWHKLISSEIRPELANGTEDWTLTRGDNILIAGSTHTGEVSGCIVDSTKVTINGREFTYTDCGSTDSYAEVRYLVNLDDIKPEFTANPDWEYWYLPESGLIKARQKVGKDTLGHNSLILIYSTDSNGAQWDDGDFLVDTSTGTQSTAYNNTNNILVTSEENEQNSDNSQYQEGNQSNASNGYSEEMNNAYEFAYKNGITTVDTIDRADMGGSLTRIAMAKMLSNYAINILGKTIDESKTPHFLDVTDDLNSQYDNGVTLAYQLGIMGVGVKNFRPYDTVTRAEFATALSRMLYGLTDGTDNYYSTHIKKLKQEGVISNDNPKLGEKRGYVMLMLMRSANG